MQDFSLWLEYNLFSHLEQKVGDLVFFGIHILNKLARDGGQLEDFDIQNYLTRIIEVDPIQGNIIVQPEKSPFSMGYRNKYLNQKTRTGQVKIPKDYLEDVSFLLPEGSTQKLWVVIVKKYGQNHYQQNILKNLKRLDSI